MTTLLGGNSPSAVAAATTCRRLAELYERLGGLPARPQRSAAQRELAAALLVEGRTLRDAYLHEHAEAVYLELVDGGVRQLRAADLVAAAAERFPGLVPPAGLLAAEQALPQKDKDGLLVDLGLFLGHVLGSPEAGHHLVHTMSLPTSAAVDLLPGFRATERADLGPVAVERQGAVGYVYLQNHRYLNAEDDAFTTALEIAVDLVLLDDRIEVGVLRGQPATHPRWAGRRVFGSGINLTLLYHGQISLVDFFVNRELGAINKMYRGHSVEPLDHGSLEIRHEKPWIAVVDAFAIGGGCQMLLVMDQVIGETGAYFNLPAGREGLIPGCGVMRMPRFLGEKTSREAVVLNRTYAADSAEGRQLFRDVVDPDRIQAAVDRSVDELIGSGRDSARAIRKMSRLPVESVDTFRVYMANYVRDQAYCVSSPALIRNLETTWINRRQRRS